MWGASAVKAFTAEAPHIFCSKNIITAEAPHIFCSKNIITAEAPHIFCSKLAYTIVCVPEDNEFWTIGPCYLRFDVLIYYVYVNKQNNPERIPGSVSIV